MRRIKVTVAFTLAFSGSAGAAGFELVSSCPTPGPAPRGFCLAQGFGSYVVQNGRPPYVYHINQNTGWVHASFPAPGGLGAWGISDPGRGFLYVSNFRTSWIYAFTTTGSVTASFRCTIGRPADTHLRYGTYMLVAVPEPNLIALLDRRTGSLVGTYPGPGERPTSCAGYAPKFVYVADSETNTIYYGGVPVITGIDTPTGLDYDEEYADGNVDVWVVDDATDHIYYYYNDSAVAPASLGRVKALFR